MNASDLRNDIREGVCSSFPETADTIMALVAGEPVEPADALEAYRSLSKGFDVPSPDRIALDYRGHIGEPVGFSDYYTPELDSRPCLDIVVILSADGSKPMGLVPLEEGTTDMGRVCEALSGFDGRIVTDRIPYSDANVSALDRWGSDWILTEPEFPPSVSGVNTKMSMLRSGECAYETCKTRYDKHWLFRFTDIVERDRIREAVKTGIGDKQVRDRMSKGAGITDCLSSQSFDIREVRRLLDIRSSMDDNMRGLWRMVKSLSPKDRSTTIGMLSVLLISMALHE